MKPVFRLDEPTDDDVSTFHRDGFLILPEVFTDEGLKGLTEEILSLQAVKDYFKSLSKSSNKPIAWITIVSTLSGENFNLKRDIA